VHRAHFDRKLFLTTIRIWHLWDLILYTLMYRFIKKKINFLKILDREGPLNFCEVNVPLELVETDWEIEICSSIFCKNLFYKIFSICNRSQKNCRYFESLLYYSSRFVFINTYDPRYNCYRSDILHKHINSPIASGTRFVTIFEPVCSRSLWPIEKRVRAAASIAHGNGGFYSYYFFVFISRAYFES